MTLRFFESMAREKKEFNQVQGTDERRDIRIYCCGPTVYNYAHIGNFRSYVWEDILVRYLKYKGYGVKKVMNLTDVDDKSIKNSREQGMNLKDYTAQYTKAFFEDMDELHILSADEYPAATEHIGEMIEIIKVLLKKGYAYKADDGCVYFDIGKFKGYGKLAHIKVDELKSGARVKHDEYEKENAADFALWKAWEETDGDVAWESPFGKGRPGWHIECTAMSMKHLSNAFDKGEFNPDGFETLDIHCGGVDNKFPHHEDEISQSEAATGKIFVKYWLHAEHLLADNKKMSKSLGNYYTLRDLLGKGYSPQAIRYILLSTHYRQQLNFTLNGLEAAANSVERLQDFIWSVQEAKVGEEADAEPGQTDASRIEDIIEKAKDDFEKAMDDDLSIAEALAALFTFVKEVNVLLSQGKMGEKDKNKILDFMKQVDSVLAVLKFEKECLSEDIENMIREREEARNIKDYGRADAIRDKLSGMGIVLQDTPDGVKWKRK